MRKHFTIVGILLLAIVAYGYFNPGVYKVVGLQHNQPYIEVYNCKMYDGDIVSFSDGYWTTSGGCEHEAVWNPNLDVYYLSFVNHSSYSFELVSITTDSPLNLYQDDAGKCHFDDGIPLPNGILISQGCASILTVDRPAIYQLNFRMSMPHDPGFMGEAIGKMNQMMEPVMPCYSADEQDGFEVSILQKGEGRVKLLSNVLHQHTYQHNLPDEGSYYIGVTLGEDLFVSIENVWMRNIDSSCINTRWYYAHADKPGTVIKISNP